MADYLVTVQGKTFTPGGRSNVQPGDVDTHNRAIEAAELKTWGTGPDRWYGYVVHDPKLGEAWKTSRDKSPARHTQLLHTFPRVTITTWLGLAIATGRIVGISWARGVSGAGGWQTRILHIRVKGTNGRTYWGKFGYDSGNFVRLRATKGATKGTA